MTYEGKIASGQNAAAPARLSTDLETVCIVGLGYVGLTLAAAMARAGFLVIGVEKSPAVRAAVAAGRAHFAETGLDEVLAELVAAQRLTAVAQLPEGGIASTYIITVGTPLAKDGAVNLRTLEEVLQGIAARLADGDMVILRSTVKCGTTREIAKRILDATAKDYDLAFCPERTLEGRALQELTSLPQIVGADEPRARRRAAALFAPFAPEVIALDRFEAAELAKLINNTHRDLMFAFANEVAQMCDAVGVSAPEVIRAGCKDYPRSRIFDPGLVGGPCLEKDTHILAESLREWNYTPCISLAGRRLNEDLPRVSIAQIAARLAWLGMTEPPGKIVILGLAFKGRPETDDLRGTMARPVLQAARARWPEQNYVAYDPIVPAEHFFSFGLTRCATLEAAFDGAHLVLIQNNHPCFAAMDLSHLAARMARPGLVYDYWNLFDPRRLSLPPGRFYAGLGTLAAIE